MSASLSYFLYLSAKRKTLSIEIKGGRVIVRSPAHLSQDVVDNHVKSKQAWINAKLNDQQRRAAEIPQRIYAQGEVFPFLGIPYPLQINHQKLTCIKLLPNHLDVQLSLRANLQKHLNAWYKHQAEICLRDKTADMAERLGVKVEEVVFRITKTKWGHCTRDGRIQYNWLIILAPEPVIDYLVAHEVSHRVHLNHSPAFWQVVERLCPDYRAHRAWLKRHGHTLVL